MKIRIKNCGQSRFTVNRCKVCEWCKGRTAAIERRREQRQRLVFERCNLCSRLKPDCYCHG